MPLEHPSSRARPCSYAGLVAILVASLSSGCSGEDEINRRFDVIAKEVATIGPAHEWAETYHGGTQTIAIAPEAGFQYRLSSCGGTSDDAHGSVDVDGSRVHLDAGWPCFWRYWDYVLVPWGARRYLVEPEELLEFVNYVNRGWEPRDSWPGVWLLACEDPQRTPLGLPRVPPEFEHMLLRTPIEGTIRTVMGPPGPDADGFYSRNYGVELDVGRLQGAFVGMELYVVGPGAQGFGTATLTEVREGTSLAHVELDSFSPPPAVGWEALSRIRDE